MGTERYPGLTPFGSSSRTLIALLYTLLLHIPEQHYLKLLVIHIVDLSEFDQSLSTLAPSPTTNPFVYGNPYLSARSSLLLVSY